jgi:hypothetical protein
MNLDEVIHVGDRGAFVPQETMCCGLIPLISSLSCYNAWSTILYSGKMGPGVGLQYIYNFRDLCSRSAINQPGQLAGGISDA